MCLNIRTLFLLFLLLFRSWCLRFGVVEVVCAALLASPTSCWRRKLRSPWVGKKTPGSLTLLLTMGRVASTILLAARQGANGARVHPSELKGKFSPQVRRESFPLGLPLWKKIVSRCKN